MDKNARNGNASGKRAGRERMVSPRCELGPTNMRDILPLLCRTSAPFCALPTTQRRSAATRNGAGDYGPSKDQAQTELHDALIAIVVVNTGYCSKRSIRDTRVELVWNRMVENVESLRAELVRQLLANDLAVLV